MDMSPFKWILRLIIIVIITECVLFVYYKTNNTSRNETKKDMSQLRCATIRQQFSVITPASFNLRLKDFRGFSEQVSELLGCQHKPNITQIQLNREMLQSCCNATGLLYMTKQNTDIKKKIPYEYSIYPSYKMNLALYNKLPEDFPWSGGRLGRCTVVGSGGILRNSNCGKEIDSADYVLRLNMAPIIKKDVGSKTNLITINPSQIRRKNQEKQFGPLTKRVRAYGNASLIMPAFASPLNTRLSISAMKKLSPLRPQPQVVFFSSYYLKTLDTLWKEHGMTAKRLSTGFMLINVALELCDHVDIYGFWPFHLNLQQKPILHHYYDNDIPRRSLHSMPDEFVRLLQLHSQGALTMHLQPCL